MRHAVWSSLLLPALLGCSSASPQIAEPIRTASANKVIDLSTHFDGLEGAFVLYDQNAGTYLRHNPQRCALRLSPCSTFKIANTLIALDTNIATGADFVIPWDQQRDPEEPWWKELGLDWAKNHTLETAFRNSVVWYYREIARRIDVAGCDLQSSEVQRAADVLWIALQGSQISRLRQVQLPSSRGKHPKTEVHFRIVRKLSDELLQMRD